MNKQTTNQPTNQTNNQTNKQLQGLYLANQEILLVTPVGSYHTDLG
jgi:hypothetical protein